MSIRKARRAAYRTGAVLGDVQAVASGDPGKVAKRVVRKAAWKAWARLARRLLG